MAQKLVEKRVLKTYQYDRYDNIRPVMLMNELQGIADRSAEEMGGGRTYCKSRGIAWVVTHYYIDILEMPRANEELTFSTWSSGSEGIRAMRDFTIHGSNNRLMVRATSQWVLLDLQTRRPLRLKENLQNWDYLPERAWNREFTKCTDFKAEKQHIFKCRYDDIDANQHINNAVYVTWATESVGFEYRNTHKLRGIEIYFEHEISADTTEVQIDVALDAHKTMHRICVNGETKAHIVCFWD
ncbi:MAG: acyl-[acyl-carrier-protein] thioesterase [Alphaproteobacteria bacterium]